MQLDDNKLIAAFADRTKRTCKFGKRAGHRIQ